MSTHLLPHSKGNDKSLAISRLLKNRTTPIIFIHNDMCLARDKKKKGVEKGGERNAIIINKSLVLLMKTMRVSGEVNEGMVTW